MKSLTNTVTKMTKLRRKVSLLLLEYADKQRYKPLDTFPHDNLLPFLMNRLKQLNPKAKQLSERTLERAVKEMITDGILEVTQPKRNYRGNCYRISQHVYEAYPDISKEIRNLIYTYVKSEEVTEMKKIGGIVLSIDNEVSYTADSKYSISTVVRDFDQEFFDLQREELNKIHEENRERYYERKKDTYPKKPRTTISVDFKLTEKIKDELKYIYTQIDDFYLQAAEQVLKDHAQHHKVMSDDWNWYMRNMILKAFKADWNIVKWKADKLRKEHAEQKKKKINQDACKSVITQPGVVKCKPAEIKVKEPSEPYISDPLVTAFMNGDISLDEYMRLTG